MRWSKTLALVIFFGGCFISRKIIVGDPMPIRLQTSHRLMSLPSLTNVIDWKTDPFEMRLDRVNPETPDEIIAMIIVSGSQWLQEQLRSLCRESIDIFSTSVRSLPAQVVPMVIDIDRSKWEVPRNRLPPWHHSTEKQTAIRSQSKKLLDL